MKRGGIVAIAPIRFGLLHSAVAVGGDGFMILLIHLGRSRAMLAFVSGCVIICE